MGVSHATADDIARRLIEESQPELTDIGDVRLASGEALTDALTRIATDAPHLFGTAEPDDGTQHKTTERARLKALKPGDRLEAANGQGVTAHSAHQLREGPQ